MMCRCGCSDLVGMSVLLRLGRRPDFADSACKVFRRAIVQTPAAESVLWSACVRRELFRGCIECRTSGIVLTIRMVSLRLADWVVVAMVNISKNMGYEDISILCKCDTRQCKAMESVRFLLFNIYYSYNNSCKHSKRNRH